jgi:hypothetical protein
MSRVWRAARKAVQAEVVVTISTAALMAFDEIPALFQKSHLPIDRAANQAIIRHQSRLIL